jgi:hypothetical protein
MNASTPDLGIGYFEPIQGGAQLLRGNWSDLG